MDLTHHITVRQISPSSRRRCQIFLSLFGTIILLERWGKRAFKAQEKILHELSLVVSHPCPLLLPPLLANAHILHSIDHSQSKADADLYQRRGKSHDRYRYAGCARDKVDQHRNARGADSRQRPNVTDGTSGRSRTVSTEGAFGKDDPIPNPAGMMAWLDLV